VESLRLPVRGPSLLAALVRALGRALGRSQRCTVTVTVSYRLDGSGCTANEASTTGTRRMEKPHGSFRKMKV